MSQRRWSPAVVHAVAQTPFGRGLGRYPAPVWTLGLWLGLSIFNVGFRMVVMPSSGSTQWVNLVVVAYLLGCVGVIAMLGARVPEWFLKVQPIAGVGYVSVLSFTAPSLMVLAATAWGFAAATIYAALWFSRRYLLVVIATMVVAYPAALLLRGNTPEALAMTVTVIVSAGGVGLLLQYLIDSLRTDAVIDPLTGLLNRRGLEVAIAMGESVGRVIDPRILVVIDLDGFKAINDERGHEAGDRLLREFGAMLGDGLRVDDLAIRSGGDEFMLILPQTDAAGAGHLMGRLAAGSPVSLSFGIAEWSSGTSFDVAAREADAQMYVHKEQRGRQSD